MAGGVGARHVSWWHVLQPANLSLGPMGTVRPLSPRPHSAMTHLHGFFGSLLVRRAAWVLPSVPGAWECPPSGPCRECDKPWAGRRRFKGAHEQWSSPAGLGFCVSVWGGSDLRPDSRDEFAGEASPLQPSRRAGLVGGCGKTARHIHVPQRNTRSQKSSPTVKEQESGRAVVGRGSPQAPRPAPQITPRNCHLASSWS